ncbi:hypothetical protein IPM09_02845 [Candidatus Saccharibacteria bacterium]|nr:MAG: hypothetical protein IPM09_02845 [Candidatus Saccharibacteria bacterium]
MATYADLRALREQTFAHCVEVTEAINQAFSTGSSYWSDGLSHAGTTLNSLVQAVRLLDDELASMKPQDAPAPKDELYNGVILLEG